MSDEKRKILEMLSEGKISVDESERLLAALGESKVEQNAGFRGRPKYLRVLVEPAGNNPDGDRVNIRVPMNLIRAGLKWASFIPKDAQGKVEEALKEKGMDLDFKQLKPDDIEDLLKNLNDLQVEVEGKDNVRIFCES